MKNKWLWIAIALLIVSVAFYRFWYEPRQAESQDKQKFEQIESTVSKLINRAKEEFPNAKFEQQNYCYYQSRKFEDPNLACVVSYKTNFESQQAVELYDSIVAQNELAVGVIREVGDDHFYGNFALSDGTSCAILEETSSKEGKFKIDCISDARSAYYNFE